MDNSNIRTTNNGLADLITIRHKHQKKIMTFCGDQKEDIVNLMEVNIE
jgi:hypothetical protein